MEVWKDNQRERERVKLFAFGSFCVRVLAQIHLKRAVVAVASSVVEKPPAEQERERESERVSVAFLTLLVLRADIETLLFRSLLYILHVIIYIYLYCVCIRTIVHNMHTYMHTRNHHIVLCITV